jgi:hypothetical protein
VSDSVSFSTPLDASRGSQLGKNAKSRATLDSKGKISGESRDQETGEILGSGTAGKADQVAVRCERYALQSIARRLLSKSRTAKCLRLRSSGRSTVDVIRSQAHGSTCYSGLQTCASVWCCPVCSAKISERRRSDLSRSIDAWEAQGAVVWLLTLTHPHTAGDALAGLLDAETKALHGFFRNRAGVGFREALGMVGHVRGWEVTHGRLRRINNGWHPHFHVLLFLKGTPAGSMAEYQAQAFEVWRRACLSAGLQAPSAAHGCTIGDGAEAAAYVAKTGTEAARTNATPDTEPHWGLDCEVTKGHTKRAKDGETPFDLLRALLADRTDHEAGRLFSEFAAAFHGRRQLVWSRGLRELVGLPPDLTDAETECLLDDDAEVLGRLSPDAWRAIVAADLRAEVLELARHGWEPVERLLTSLGVANVPRGTLIKG